MNGKINSLPICLPIFSLSFHSSFWNSRTRFQGLTIAGRVNSAFYLGMGYMRISFKSPNALSFPYTTIFKCEKTVCVCVCGGGMSYKSKEYFLWEKNRYHEVSLTNQKSMMLVHFFFTLLYCIQAFQEGWCIIIIDEPLFCMGTYRRRFRRSFSTKTSVFSTKLLHHNNFSAW